MLEQARQLLVPLIILAGFLAIGLTIAWWDVRHRRAVEAAAAAMPDEVRIANEKDRLAKEKAAKRRARELAEEHAAAAFAQEFGEIRPPMICPHCQSKGTVYCKEVQRKKGVSGAKATGALLTGGLSLLVVGLSRKESDTQAHCASCEATWFF